VGGLEKTKNTLT
jgi:hypothetical protein